MVVSTFLWFGCQRLKAGLAMLVCHIAVVRSVASFLGGFRAAGVGLAAGLAGLSWFGVA